MSSFSWTSLLLKHFFGRSADFEKILATYLGAKDVVIADAWVHLLAAGLRTLANDKQREVILPAYACNEFYKAILLAGLVPAPVDLTESGEISVEAARQAMNPNTLALLAVNNTGICSDLPALKELCVMHGVWMIEDAGYTIFGKHLSGKPFGSFGHASIINMSEGKIIPVGGAAWVVHDTALLSGSNHLRKVVHASKAETEFKSLLRLLIYRIGSSRWGFSLYQLVKQWGLGDLKARFTSEPSRFGEHYASGDLVWEGEELALAPQHQVHLNEIQMQPWSNARHLVAVQIFEQRELEAQRRRQQVDFVLSILPKGMVAMGLPKHGMPVKLPVIINKDMKAEKLESFAVFGFKKQYPTSWPMAQWSFPQSRAFYRSVYTWPIHPGMHKSMHVSLAKKLKDLT